MPKQPRLTLILILGVSLFGCGSFNSYRYPTPVILVAPTNPGAPPITVLADCVYHFPEAEAIPPLPLDELAKISKTDDEALDALQQNHIKELRNYIRRTQLLYRTAYQEYLKRCAPDPHSAGKNTG